MFLVVVLPLPIRSKVLRVRKPNATLLHSDCMWFVCSKSLDHSNSTLRLHYLILPIIMKTFILPQAQND